MTAPFPYVGIYPSYECQFTFNKPFASHAGNPTDFRGGAPERYPPANVTMSLQYRYKDKKFNITQIEDFRLVAYFDALFIPRKVEKEFGTELRMCNIIYILAARLVRFEEDSENVSSSWQKQDSDLLSLLRLICNATLITVSLFFGKNRKRQKRKKNSGYLITVYFNRDGSASDHKK